MIYIFVNIPFENKHFTDLNPVICGYEDCLPSHTGGVTIRDYYLVHYVKKGAGFFEVKGERKNVKPGQIFILHKNQVGYYEADEKNPWEYIWIGFDGNLASQIELLEDQVLDFSGSIFDEMKESEKIKNTRSEFLAAKLFEFVSQLFEEKNKTSYVKQVKDYIKSSYMFPLKVDDIAASLNINRRYLSRIFREETGVPIKTYITNTKMNRAEQLLRQGFSVGTVAEMVGYEDVFNFSKMFKKVKGYPPKNSKQKKLEF